MKWSAVLGLIVGAIIVVSLVLWVRSLIDGNDARAELRIERALMDADSLRAFALRETKRADSLDIYARQLALRASERHVATQARIAEVQKPVPPDTCIPFVAPRDSIIAEQEAQIEDWRLAFDARGKVIAALQGSNAALLTSVDSLILAIEARPGRRPSWLPMLGVGAVAGMCSTGKPCVAVGVGLTWRVL